MVELLAPAGNMECFKAALYAGADAIYVGGKKYGARAYAGNFEKDELIECLHMAHLFDKKVYLTVNTLMKQEELDELIDDLTPLCVEGLDGVIVQDFGALMRISNELSEYLEIHASTQMTVTGAYGAEILKALGVSRIVPARELSLSEIKRIKDSTGLEIETFVHGAMCYGYSGQCLFSSMLGERSGNRGRCAGPCRLPYHVKYNGKQLNREDERYPLSLKDLCTLEVLPELIDAGIDSFKIEGRMKTPEYVSFVTGMYRKYIDLYFSNPKNYHVAKEDLTSLRQRFSRGSIQTGYYFQHNGRELVTLNKPGYQSFALEPAKNAIDTTNNNNNGLKIDLTGHFCATADQPMWLSVHVKNCSDVSTVVFGERPTEAQTCAATKEAVKKQLCKTGNTCFSFDEITFEMENNLFLPNKILNDLRRAALKQIEEMMLQKYKKDVLPKPHQARTIRKENNCANIRTTIIEVRTMEQLATVADIKGIDRLLLDSEIFLTATEEEMQDKAKRIRKNKTEIYIKFPHVCRERAIKNIDMHRDFIESLSPDGFCVGNLEILGYVRKKYPKIKCMSDAGMYVFNEEASAFFETYGIAEHIFSYELHRKEMIQLSETLQPSGHSFFLPVYGFVPVMETAGCLLKTYGVCRNGKGQERVFLTDRHNKERIVVTHCDRCENTIYNSVPLSLHKEKEQISKMPISGIVLKFTIENAYQTKQMTDFWIGHEQNAPEKMIREFTKGHFLKGVE